MNNNTKQTSNSRRGRDNTADFKPRRSRSKKNSMGLGAQPVELKGCNYARSANDTELVKLELEHLVSGITETFNFINGSAALDAVMDVIDPTGELDVDLAKHKGTKMNVEIVESGKFRNIINAWALEEEQEEEEREEDTNEVYHDDENGDNDYDNNAYEIAQMVNDDDEVENAVRELLSDNCEEEQ
ncbi:MAG: hypothetical protein KHY44_14960 [Clostridiales bacterium]|jgi:hypothetical protein|nr:hypothetical protein [Clostridiales bacterium]